MDSQSTEGTQRAHERPLNLEVLGPLALWSPGMKALDLKGLILLLRHTGSTDSLDRLDRWFRDCACPANDCTLDRCSVKHCK